MTAAGDNDIVELEAGRQPPLAEKRRFALGSHRREADKASQIYCAP